MKRTESPLSHRRDEGIKDGAQDYYFKQNYVTIRVREKKYKGNQQKVLYVRNVTKKIRDKLLKIKRRENE